MQVQNIECQIAQAQIGRFVSGGGLSPEALTQLEGHIGECGECAAFLAERKAALQSMLSGAATAAVEVSDGLDRSDLSDLSDAGTRPTAGLVARLRDQLARAATQTPNLEAAPERRVALKPLLYSGALAAVLVAMSLLSKNPTALFGEKALPAGAPAASSPAQDAAPADPAGATANPPTAAKPDPTPPTAASPTPPEAAPVSNPSPTTPAPAVESSSSKPAPPRAQKPKPATPRPAATRQAPKPAPPTPTPKPHGSIRVYDANGNPINPGR